MTDFTVNQRSVEVKSCVLPCKGVVGTRRAAGAAHLAEQCLCLCRTVPGKQGNQIEGSRVKPAPVLLAQCLLGHPELCPPTPSA